MNEKIIEKLKKSGLSEKEARIYAYLLEVQGSHPSEIAAKTLINRSTCYKILESLSVKGLIAEVTKQKKIFYHIESPKKLERFARYGIELAEKSLEQAKSVIPELEGLLVMTQEKPKVTFYEGRERVIDAYLQHVEVKKGYNMVAFVNVRALSDFLPPKIFKHYIMEKERLGIIARGITSTDPYSYQFLDETHKSLVNKKIFPILKRVPYDLFPFPAEITMFDNNKVSIVKFDDKNPVGVIIEDKTIHNMMFQIFEMAWIGVDNLTNK